MNPDVTKDLLEALEELVAEFGVCGLTEKARAAIARAEAALAAPQPDALEQARAEEREACARVCDEIAADRWNIYKGRSPYSGREEGRASPHVQGENSGAEMCAEAIRERRTAAKPSDRMDWQEKNRAEECKARPDLTCVIQWLEAGCDPKDAATELRLLQEKIRARRES